MYRIYDWSVKQIEIKFSSTWERSSSISSNLSQSILCSDAHALYISSLQLVVLRERLESGVHLSILTEAGFKHPQWSARSPGNCIFGRWRRVLVAETSYRSIFTGFLRFQPESLRPEPVAQLPPELERLRRPQSIAFSLGPLEWVHFVQFLGLFHGIAWCSIMAAALNYAASAFVTTLAQYQQFNIELEIPRDSRPSQKEYKKGGKTVIYLQSHQYPKEGKTRNGGKKRGSFCFVECNHEPWGGAENAITAHIPSWGEEKELGIKKIVLQVRWGRLFVTQERSVCMLSPVLFIFPFPFFFLSL